MYWMNEVMSTGVPNIPCYCKCLKSTPYNGKSNCLNPDHPLQATLFIAVAKL